MPTLQSDGNDLSLRRFVSGGKGANLIHRNHFIVKFDISALAGTTIDTAEFNAFLFANAFIATDQQTLISQRYTDNAGTVDQTWTEATSADVLYVPMQFTFQNVVATDSLLFLPATPTGIYYSWDIPTMLQAAIDDGDTFLTVAVSRTNAGFTGTAQKEGAGSNLFIRGTSRNRLLTFLSTEAGSNPPTITYELVQAVRNYYLGGNAMNRGKRGMAWAP